MNITGIDTLSLKYLLSIVCELDVRKDVELFLACPFAAEAG